MTAVYVAAGSNVEPEKHLSVALRALAAAYGPMTLSPAYKNKAVGFEGADFINLVVGFNTEDSVAEVRRQLQKIEAACDRPPDAPKWAPRTMDLDILLFGDLVSNQPGLVIPRPDLVKRPYMLKPMADIAPDVRHPMLDKTMRELWESFQGGEHAMVEVLLGGEPTSPHSAPHRSPESGR
ncbi:2-amino-4-hydroxy-6-hydroxymethyldihydropteridine diphosphokinase [Steroidobacter agaridevorans]|uniref:2-amino-4-hydroxy-6-hydroxymethyldihydropteridine diphosphokinase n=1 Tax=Steroidobacter agaridevorans TaxID=2695856 RepID=A0A829YEJ3_9GAMM|nr:2-amino-4-hydroxy-6-hydroxymethyldihydropteridine diphosphokinase [Steroidobacter agaridevorans]GFE81221.1 2-amino-4-hydroxy-6-hydroxymethyldihydropteridine diphosphokinase [Steroidobacter agaridevorans]GFE88895.1 2-amino-4-hydroxy-6-hydroxymethyldihydropteridine diphosphokinase [Steroidobacter agaridevorans]